ncbi:MAG: hypothetical protein CO128_10765 [Ignavibacteriales bacterium CG_4_9_14_3_um_filter_30_11]|nr:MAG: hypothetical protein CO128_10765 [Ignavibacteriales bacterium CG_4_9_14_3_um_filter_30_11]
MHKGISEIVLIVEDVKKSADFYKDVVGLYLQTEIANEWAWFWTCEKEKSSRLALHKGKLLFEEHSPFPKGERWGSVHFAIEVNRLNLESVLSKLKNSNVKIYGPIEFEWMNAISYYFYDLDGNLVEYWPPNK